MCLGHQERASRSNIIAKLITKSVATPDENCRISIKKGPVSVETSLKELEEDYESKPEWRLIKEGGVLSLQSPKNLGGRVALPSGKFLRVRKAFAGNP